jgi:hypothetical protein
MGAPMGQWVSSSRIRPSPGTASIILGMRKALKLLKEIVEWVVPIWHILGWFGLAAVISGALASIGGAVWAMLIGVPVSK